MKVPGRSSPFGSPTRTRVLLGLELTGESYARELSRVLQVSLSVVQKALRSLELDGLVAARSAGRTRLYRIDPRYSAEKELRVLLRRLAGSDDELQARLGSLRTRPRRGGKPL